MSNLATVLPATATFSHPNKQYKAFHMFTVTYSPSKGGNKIENRLIYRNVLKTLASLT